MSERVSPSKRELREAKTGEVYFKFTSGKGNAPERGGETNE